MEEAPSPYKAPAIRTRATVLHGRERLQSEEIPLEAFSGGLHVQVSIRAVGLSSSDIHQYAHSPQASSSSSQSNGVANTSKSGGVVLGKEGAGMIVAVGARVNKTFAHLRIGKRVVLEPAVPCRICRECSSGRYNICQKLTKAGAGEGATPGFLRELVNWPAEMVHELPQTVSYDLATLAEPLANIIHAARRADMRPHAPVAVIGAGLLGLLTCAYANSLACFPILLIDRDATRLELAKSQRWAARTFDLSTYTPSASSSQLSQNGKTGEDSSHAALNAPQDHEKMAQDIFKQIGYWQRFEQCFDTTGSEEGLSMAFHLARRGGKVVSLGEPSTLTPRMPLQYASNLEIDLISVHGYRDTFPLALASLSSGTMGDLRRLITHKVPLDRVESGFRWMLAAKEQKTDPVIKVIVGEAATT